MAAAQRAQEEAAAPAGASSTLRGLYANFPRPTANAEVAGSAGAIKAGVKACKGKTPIEVKRLFYGRGASRLTRQQLKLVGRIAAYEEHSGSEASFTAGQLAADVYQATLPEAVSQYGYQGCVYALARGLERQLSPRG